MSVSINFVTLSPAANVSTESYEEIRRT